jgi:hypothetical protein
VEVRVQISKRLNSRRWTISPGRFSALPGGWCFVLQIRLDRPPELHR